MAISLLLALGAEGVATHPTALVAAVESAGAGWSAPIVRAGAAIASLGALLALIAGIGRTSLAIARAGDLPRPLAEVSARFQVPNRAQVAVGILVAVLVLTTDLRGVIGFSSFGVLVYYAVANAAAYTQPVEHRRWPRLVNVLGFAGA